MSVGAWEPEKAPQQSGEGEKINRELLQRYISALQSTAPLPESLSPEDRQASYLMRLPAQRWLEESEAWNKEQLWQLIRFFTLAEAQLPGWHAGAESPVIPLARSLRQRGAPLDRDQLLWIKQHSDNRYLPYGPL
ncbi:MULTISPECIES: hypothetical protein [unclassified Microbulbifer]|uniref:hypothetical protein n=1 Tax=unclassified Microbulbifer TaxID=2619833 RepID=UPI0027E51153|nr:MULTISPECIES: hypothetical protein [unclassified Microbulbifer]